MMGEQEVHNVLFGGFVDDALPMQFSSVASRGRWKMIGFRASRSLLALALFVSPSAAVGQSGVPAEQETTPPCSTSRPISPIPANAEQVANEIGIMPLVQRVLVLDSGCNQAGATSVEELALRQQITEAVVTASLDVDSVLAEINFERAQISETEALLSKGRDHRIELLAIANLVASAVGAVGSGLELSNRTTKAGDIVSVVGGTAGVILTTLSLRQQGGARSLGIAPNMLAPVFGRTPELRSVYPQDVWTYLNTAPAAHPSVHPWKDQLIAEWVRLKRIGPPDAPGSQTKIDELTSSFAEHERLPIGCLDDRSAMLADLGTRVSLMNLDLRDLMKAVPVPPAR
jgi:hypothetical protein